ncbi:metallophosphoesterase [Pseudomonadales bacterium]|nr:metallophosphoesterase [Pseudomonadales bacterium]
MYDLIGDIHGHADELVKLLTHLGYANGQTGYQHQSRKVIFLGDFIDRGEDLAQHRALLGVVMAMVRNGHALAVMGNHEFNALAYHTRHNGLYLRPHTKKNNEQHQAFLNEYGEDPEAKQQVLDFFYELPLWLELEGLRVVHACWDARSMQALTALGYGAQLTPELLVKASKAGSTEYGAVETLLKGYEVPLPPGVSFKDERGFERTNMRTQWWQHEATCLQEIALPADLDLGAAANDAIPSDMPRYGVEEKPCFVGHYWLRGEPAPRTHNVVCLDYSVAKQGKLVAYRWSGEAVLRNEHFAYVG